MLPRVHCIYTNNNSCSEINIKQEYDVLCVDIAVLFECEYFLELQGPVFMKYDSIIQFLSHQQIVIIITIIVLDYFCTFVDIFLWIVAVFGVRV